jgi:glycosyltransferase involved in cell wall biosynthesis
MVNANLISRLARPLAPVPVLLTTAHSTYEGAPWRYVLYRLTTPLAELMTTVSQASAERHLRRKATPPAKLRVIPNGIDMNRFVRDRSERDRVRSAEGLHDRFCWLAVGRFEEAKDYPNLLAAFGKVAAERDDVLLLIVGRGPLDSSLRSIVEAKGLSARVRFLGGRSDVPALMNASDGYVMSSAWEGLPLVLIEAAASGLPTVATRVGGVGEIVVEGKSGTLVPPGDSKLLASAMLSIMCASSEVRASMGLAARAHVEKAFDLQVVSDCWEAVYRELLMTKGIRV